MWLGIFTGVEGGLILKVPEIWRDFFKLHKIWSLYAIVRRLHLSVRNGNLVACRLGSWQGMRIRSSDPAYIEAVARYYDQLLPRPCASCWIMVEILMMQVENEYGSYGEDKSYLRAIRKVMEDRGLIALFTSDGPWRLLWPEWSKTIFVIGNFGSKAPYNFSQMQNSLIEHGKKWPLMCMEFWDGWFNRWKEPIITRDP